MKYCLTLLAWIACGSIGYSQNQEPFISNLRAEVKADQRQLAISYDLSDREDHEIKVTLGISRDGGATYLVNTTAATGDIGGQVRPGNGKKIVWNYPDTLVHVEKLKIRLIADDLYKIDISELIEQVDVAWMRSDLEYVSGMRSLQNGLSLRHLENVRSYIAGVFSVADLYAYYQNAVIGERIAYRNVVGRLAGNTDEETTYVLGAHIDTSDQSEGVDDNGSGIVGMLEAARILSRYNFERSIKFVGFDGQAIGYVGSKLYAEKGIKDFERIAGVIDLDMIGFCDDTPNSQTIPEGFDIIFPETIERIKKNDSKGDFIINTYNAESRAFGAAFESNAKKFVPKLRVISLEAPDNGVSTPELTASDHYQFWLKGVPALHLGDGGVTRNPDMKRDRLEDLNFSFLSNVVKATIATLAELAGIQHSDIKHCNVTVSTK